MRQLPFRAKPNRLWNHKTRCQRCGVKLIADDPDAARAPDSDQCRECARGAPLIQYAAKLGDDRYYQAQAQAFYLPGPLREEDDRRACKTDGCLNSARDSRNYCHTCTQRKFRLDAKRRGIGEGK